jgi:hypothetical protein
MLNVDVICGYIQAMYMRNVFLNFNNKNVMSVVKGTWIEMDDKLIHKRGEGLRECPREGSKGELPMSINSTHIPKFYYDYVLNSSF